jgi:DNA-directed RNA polymerase specialized sigma24 family protein
MEVDPAALQHYQRHVFAVPYRLLGSVTDAENAVQQAYLRWASAHPTDICGMGSWLATVVLLVCLDQRRNARGRRESYLGPWRPEALAGDALAPGPAEHPDNPDSHAPHQIRQNGINMNEPALKPGHEGLTPLIPRKPRDQVGTGPAPGRPL